MLSEPSIELDPEWFTGGPPLTDLAFPFGTRVIKNLRDCWNNVMCHPARCAVWGGFLCCGVAVTVALNGYGCSSPCERTWTSETLQSPDRLWTAVVYEESCDRGLFRDFKRLVELRRADEASGTPVLFPEGQWDGHEDVRLRWLEPNVLEVSVPNRTVLNYQVREHGSVEIRVAYRNDDPEDRSRWIRALEERRAWLADGARRGVPKPKMPPPTTQHE